MVRNIPISRPDRFKLGGVLVSILTLNATQHTLSRCSLAVPQHPSSPANYSPNPFVPDARLHWNGPENRRVVALRQKSIVQCVRAVCLSLRWAP